MDICEVRAQARGELESGEALMTGDWNILSICRFALDLLCCAVSLRCLQTIRLLLYHYLMVPLASCVHLRTTTMCPDRQKYWRASTRLSGSRTGLMTSISRTDRWLRLSNAL